MTVRIVDYICGICGHAEAIVEDIDAGLVTVAIGPDGVVLCECHGSEPIEPGDERCWHGDQLAQLQRRERQ